MKTGKKTRPLPTRGGLNDLGKSGRTVADYAKSVPSVVSEPAAIQNIRNPRKGK